MTRPQMMREPEEAYRRAMSIARYMIEDQGHYAEYVCRDYRMWRRIESTGRPRIARLVRALSVREVQHLYGVNLSPPKPRPRLTLWQRFKRWLSTDLFPPAPGVESR